MAASTPAPGTVETARRAGLDRLADALVVGDRDAAALVVADGHAPPAAAADGEALQQGGAFAGGTGGAFGAVGLGVGGEQALVGLELLPGDVAGVGVGDQRRPLVAGQRLVVRLAVGVLAVAAAAVDERAGVARVVQGAQHPPVAQRHPGQLALVRRRCGPGPGTAGPRALKAWTTARAEPVRAKVANRWRMACCTPASGSSTTLPAGS